MRLRPYQRRLIDDLRMTMATYPRIIACAATGSGKTPTFVRIALDALARGTTVLVLAESKKIFHQIHDQLPSVRIINADSKGVPVLPGYGYLAMSQTVQRRKHMMPLLHKLGAKLLILVDEAHIGTHSKILEALPDAYIIGFTASPNYKDAKHLPRIYQELVLGPQPFELVQDGFLAPYRHFARTQADLSALETLSTGDFSAESQERVFETAKVYAGLFEDLHKMYFRKAIVFCSSIRHAEDVTAQLHSHGFYAVCVHTERKDAEEQLNEFLTPDGAPICVSVGILTKGFDFPAIDLVVLQRATTSLALYLQMIGRGSRIHPGKAEFTVLDYGGNYQRHGLWDFERDWHKLWKPQGKSRPQVAPIKICPNCESILHSAAMVCKHCGYEFPANTLRPIEDSRLVEITGAYHSLVGRMLSTLSAQELAIYAKLKQKKGHAIRVAKHWEQKQPGFLKQFGDAMGYAPGWARFQSQELPTEEIDFFDLQLR